MALQPKLGELRHNAVSPLTKPVTPPVTPPRPTPPVTPFIEPGPTPSAKTANDLRELYGESQVEGDSLPEWISGEAKQNLLRVRCVGSDPRDWKSLIVVGPLYDALIQLDGGAKIDLEAGTLSLPKFGKELPLNVKPEHFDP